MEADAGEKSSRFRCLNAARYVVAAVVTVLIVLISLNTAKLVLYDRSHDTISLWVAKGFVYVRSTAAPVSGGPPAFMFYLAIRVSSDRGFNYYADITTACLFNESTSSPTPPESAAIVCLDEPGRIIKAVEQQAGHYFLMEAKATRDAMKRHPHYLDALYNNGSNLEDATLLVRGTFIAEPRSGRNITSRNNITYSCKRLYVDSDRKGDDKGELLDRGYDQLCELENGSQPS